MVEAMLPNPASTVSGRGTDNNMSHDSAKDLGSPGDVSQDLEKSQEKTQKPLSARTVPFIVEFQGPTDPDFPKSWTEKRRWAITVAMGLMVFTVTFASSIFSVNIGYVRQRFDVSLVTATLGVALFVLVCLFGLCIS